MTRRRIVIVMAAIALAAAVGFGLGRGQPEDEKRIRELFGSLEKAVNDGDHEAVVEHLSADFEERPFGYDIRQIKRTVFVMKRTGVMLKVDMAINDVEVAPDRNTARVLGVIEVRRGREKGVFDFEVKMIRDGGAWKAHRARTKERKPLF